jgi:hypothetical protein
MMAGTLSVAESGSRDGARSAVQGEGVNTRRAKVQDERLPA